MRPTWDYRDDGTTAYLNNLSEDDNPHPKDSLAHYQWLQGFLSERVIVLSDEYPHNISDEHNRIDDIKYLALQLGYRLNNDLPTAEEVAIAIDVDLSEWPSNCYGIAEAILSSGVLDPYQEKHGKLFLTYGQYHGDIAPTSIFANRPFARHGWLESPLGHVVDPTRYVFFDTKPEIWAGPINDYDMSGARLRERMSPIAPEITTSDLVKLPLNSPDSLAVFDRILGNTTREIERSGKIELTHLRWIANRPVADMGIDAPMILRTIESMGKAGFMPIDTRNWIAEVSEWREHSQAVSLRP